MLHFVVHYLIMLHGVVQYLCCDLLVLCSLVPHSLHVVCCILSQTITSRDLVAMEPGNLRPITAQHGTIWSSTIAQSSTRPGTGINSPGTSWTGQGAGINSPRTSITGPGTSTTRPIPGAITIRSSSGYSATHPGTPWPGASESSLTGPMTRHDPRTVNLDPAISPATTPVAMDCNYDSGETSTVTKRLNPRIYRPIEIQSFQNQTASGRLR